MRHFLSAILTVCLALWLGGQATLVLLIVTLFIKDRPTAIHAGPLMFHVFERYQLLVAATAILTSLALLVMTRRKTFGVMLALFCVTAIGGVISVTTTTRRLEALWAQGLSEGPEFASLHVKSTWIYRTEMILLLIAACLLPAALRAINAPRTAPETVPA